MTQQTIGRQSAAGPRPGVVLSSTHMQTGYAAGGKAARIVEITIGTAADDTPYGFDISGLDSQHQDTLETLTANSGAGATKTSIRDQMIAEHDADIEARRRVEAYDSASDKFRLEGRRSGDSFTVSGLAANMSQAEIQAATDGQPIPFGYAVARGLAAGEAELPRNNAGALLRPLLGLALGAAREADMPDQLTVSHKPGQTVPVLYFGEAACVVEPGIVPAVGDAVHVRLVASGSKLIGMLTNAAVADETVAVSELKWTDSLRSKWGNETVASVFANFRG